jgi:hypothetical protein
VSKGAVVVADAASAIDGLAEISAAVREMIELFGIPTYGSRRTGCPSRPTTPPSCDIASADQSSVQVKPHVGIP